MIKDKRKLKNYLINNQFLKLRVSCYYIDNKYIISDCHSIVCLNEDNGLDVVKENDVDNYYKKLDLFKKEFSNAVMINEIIPDFKENYYNINDNWGIDLKLVKEIKNLIKGNIFNVKQCNNGTYILEIFNNKTGEIGYLLPCKRY